MFGRKKILKKGPALSCLSVGYCSEKKCPLWVTLKMGYLDPENKKIDKIEGACSVSWVPLLLVEFKNELIEVLRKNKGG